MIPGPIPLPSHLPMVSYSSQHLEKVRPQLVRKWPLCPQMQGSACTRVSFILIHSECYTTVGSVHVRGAMLAMQSSRSAGLMPCLQREQWPNHADCGPGVREMEPSAARSPLVVMICHASRNFSAQYALSFAMSITICSEGRYYLGKGSMMNNPNDPNDSNDCNDPNDRMTGRFADD